MSQLRKFSLVIMLLAAAYGYSVPAGAVSFSFGPQSDAGGTGTATMQIQGLDSETVIATVENTSPLTLDDGTGVNAPAITAFGFESANDPLLGLNGWKLEAFDASDNKVQIGGSGFTGPWELTIDGNVNGIKVDYSPNTTNGVKGGIYNPLQTDGFASTPNYFTTATLTLEFDGDFLPNFEVKHSPFVRMQNVGLDGEGSLKLEGTPFTPPSEAPEPSTMLLLGSGLVGLTLWGRRRRNKVG